MKIKKQTVILAALSLLLLFAGFGCDTGGVCTENVIGIGMTAAAKLYYPCNIGQYNGTVPASTMSSGWTAGLNAIEWLSRPMANEGVVVLAFTPLNRYGLVTDWMMAHKNTFQRLKQINQSHIKLRGKIDESKMQIAGYSKGGGGTLAAAADLGGSVASAIGMAPYCGGEYNMMGLRSMRAATFIQAGGVSDTLARPPMTQSEFSALPNGISKLYKRHAAWGHLEWAMGVNQGTIKNEIFAWMKYYLNNDQSDARYLENRTGLSAYTWVK